MQGVYHRHADAGSFSLIKNGLLAATPNYPVAAGPLHDEWIARTIGANTLTVYDPTDCWKDHAATCGVTGGYNLVNDGGQRRTLRRYDPPFNSNKYELSRLWSGTLLSDPVYNQLARPNLPVLKVGAGFELIRNDISRAYANSYSGSGDNPRRRTSSVVRQIVHFQPTLGSLDPFVVFDKVVATDASSQKSWLFHTVGPLQLGDEFRSAEPGIKTNDSATVARSDNGAARVYVKTLLPASPVLRTVGGRNCAPVRIIDCTQANPMVCTTASPHGMAPGEQVSISAQVTNVDPWSLDAGAAGTSFSVAANPAPTATTFSLLDLNNNPVNRAGMAHSWAESYVEGPGAPASRACGFDGQTYFQTDATSSGNTWQCYTSYAPGSQWLKVPDLGKTRTGVYLTAHSGCDWSYWVDQFGPPKSPGANLWSSFAEMGNPALQAQWRLEVRPSTPQTTDYFMNVITATDTKVNTAPAAVLISNDRAYGVQVNDSGGVYIAVFPATPGNLAGLDYSTRHAGKAIHVVTGLEAGTYVVSQNGAALSGRYRADGDGTISFRESGGGTFQIAQSPAVAGTEPPSPAANFLPPANRGAGSPPAIQRPPLFRVGRLAAIWPGATTAGTNPSVPTNPAGGWERCSEWALPRSANCGNRP